jgi:alkyldihydroxyacetonephosphate synthase
MDNKQFVFGMALKTEEKSKLHEAVNAAKKYFITEIMGFDPTKMTLCTILFEGSADEVNLQIRTINALAKKHRGFKAGAENGERGYFLTFMIGYIRDFGMKYNFIAESFETSIPWKDVSRMCEAVNKRIAAECRKQGVKREPFLSSRVTQVARVLVRCTIQERWCTFISDSVSKDSRIRLEPILRSRTPQEMRF